MNDQTDSELLRSYAERSVEPAFAELVRRHVDFVYSAASRMVRDPHLAEDVTQGVFVALAKSAPQLLNRATLSGWLHQTARNIAAQTVRTIERRRTREQEAAIMYQLFSSQTEASWEQLAPYLDAALGELSETDRDAVLLRYFEKKSASEIAQRLGMSDEAAQKRVSRAVERLREFFAKRKITVGAGGLVALISTNAVQSAPVGLSAAISAAALAGTAATTSTMITAAKTIAMTSLQKTVVTAAFVAAACAGIFEARQAAQLREQIQMLQQAQAPLAEQNERLQRERDAATNRLAVLGDEIAKVNHNNLELLKLRALVSSLSQQNQELAALTNALAASLNENSRPIDVKDYAIPESWANAGVETATAAARTYLWAMANTNLTKLKEVLSFSSSDNEAIWESFSNGWPQSPIQFNGARISEACQVSDDKNECLFTIEEVETSLAVPESGGGPAFPITSIETKTLILRRTNEVWHVLLGGNRELSPEEEAAYDAEADNK